MKSVVLVLGLLLVQNSQPQAPASIEGTVVRLGTSMPVVRARVSVMGAQTMTDENGKFVLRNLQPGRYRISANHNSYVPAQYGQRSRGSSGAELTIAAGQNVKDIVIALLPRSAITGRVYDRYGDPVTNATVQALKYAYQDGHRILIPAESTRTNDLGEYRLYWLVPGPYMIGATPPESPCADAPCSVLLETRNVSAASPVIGGTVRPDGRVAVAAPDPGETHLPVYYPGTTDVSMASMVDVPPGINLTGVDLMIVETLAARARGRVVNGVTGQPAVRASVTLVPRRGTVATGTPLRASVSPTGTFEFRHMAPGAYDLVASLADPASGKLATSLPVDIAGTNIDNINLVLQPQVTITGKLSVEGLQGDRLDLKPTNIRVELRREPYTPELLVLLPTVAADGTFTLSGVTPGDYRLKVTTIGLKTYIKSARLGGVDALNPPFRVDGSAAQLDIVLSLNAGALEALVVDDARKPVNDATVVLVPELSRRQRFDLYVVSGTDSSGHAHFEGLPPGDYKMFAWSDVPADAWADPDFLRPYEDRGRAVRITEGSNESIEVRLLPGL